MIGKKMTFLLANGSSGHNFIDHIDVYQGKNRNNVLIPSDLLSLKRQ